MRHRYLTALAFIALAACAQSDRRTFPDDPSGGRLKVVTPPTSFDPTPVPPPPPSSPEEMAAADTAYRTALSQLLPQTWKTLTGRAMLLEDRTRSRSVTRLFQGYAVTKSTPLPTPLLSTIVAALNDPRTYAASGAACFDPGVGLRLEFDGAAFECVLCLHCGYLHLPPGLSGDRRPLSTAGIAQLTNLFRSVFPEIPAVQ